MPVRCLLQKNNNNAGPGVKEYTQLTPGNYWVYKTFNIGDTSFFSPPSETDSIYVLQDTVMNGHTYHELGIVSSGGTGLEATYLRDSLDYLIDHKGNIWFSSSDFSHTFYHLYYIQSGVGINDSVGLCERKMADKDIVVSVPAGTFTTSSLRETWYLHPDNRFNGPAVRSRDTRYAAGIGMISQVIPFYLQSPFYVERRLVRYHVH